MKISRYVLAFALSFTLRPSAGANLDGRELLKQLKSRTNKAFQPFNRRQSLEETRAIVEHLLKTPDDCPSFGYFAADALREAILFPHYQSQDLFLPGLQAMDQVMARKGATGRSEALLAVSALVSKLPQPSGSSSFNEHFRRLSVALDATSKALYLYEPTEPDHGEAHGPRLDDDPNRPDAIVGNPAFMTYRMSSHSLESAVGIIGMIQTAAIELLDRSPGRPYSRVLRGRIEKVLNDVLNSAVLPIEVKSRAGLLLSQLHAAESCDILLAE